MNDKYIPLRSGEPNDLQMFWACREVFDMPEHHIEKRLKACNRWRQFRIMKTWMANITNDLMLTIEPKKAEAFLLNLMNQQIRVVSKSHITSHPDYTIINSEVLGDIILTAMNDTCKICNGEGCDMAHCKFRKALKKAMMFEIDESGGVCMGKAILDKLEV